MIVLMYLFQFQIQTNKSKSMNGGDSSSKNVADPIDYSRGVLWQVGALRDAYWQWTMTPIYVDMRLFDSDVLEFTSRTKWHTIPALWLPIACVFAFFGYEKWAKSFSGMRN